MGAVPCTSRSRERGPEDGADAACASHGEKSCSSPSSSSIAAASRSLHVGHMLSSAKARMTFPMYVVHIDVVKKFDSFPKHEDLHERGDLEQWSPGAGDVIFFSHVWLSLRHPDPAGVQWKVLKSVFTTLSEAARKVRVFWQQEFLFGPVSMKEEFADCKHCWVDYACAPQEDTKRLEECIKNIYAYVCNSKHFVVVVPPAMHIDHGEVYDYSVWGMRGWCRVEMFCNSIAKQGKVVVADSSSRLYIDMAGGRDALLKPPGLGKFGNPDDRRKLGPVLEELVDKRILDDFANGDLVSGRLLKATRQHLLIGLDCSSPEFSSFEDWMADYQFNTPLDDECSGWSPLRFAVYEGRYDIAERLLEAKADVEAPLKEALPGVGYHTKNISVLGALSFMREDPEGIKFLVQNSARLDHLADNDLSPLHMAVVVGLMQNTKALVELGADMHAINKFGDDAAGSAIFGGQKEVATWLIDKGSRTLETTTVFGWRSTFGALVCTADASTLQAVIELKADVDFRCVPHGFGKVVCTVLQGLYMFKWRDTSDMVELFSQVPGMTPLGIAAMTGNSRAIKVLLDAKADCNITNDYGRTPLHQAAIKGHVDALQVLMHAAPTILEVKDSWGRTAAAWAQMKNHPDALEVLLNAGATVAG